MYVQCACVCVYYCQCVTILTTKKIKKPKYFHNIESHLCEVKNFVQIFIISEWLRSKRENNDDDGDGSQWSHSLSFLLNYIRALLTRDKKKFFSQRSKHCAKKMKIQRFSKKKFSQRIFLSCLAFQLIEFTTHRKHNGKGFLFRFGIRLHIPVQHLITSGNFISHKTGSIWIKLANLKFT